jgi:pimeloyl-ACP methyl ester carboxylesterase
VEFETPQEMFDRLKDKPSYAAWVPEALRDYCFHGLLTKAVSLSLSHQISSARSGGQLDEQQPREDMPLRLACPGWAEAATYAGSTKDSDRDRYSEITVPVTILRATKQATTPGSQGGDFRMSPTDPHLHKLFTAGNAVDVHLGEADAAGSREDWVSHFIPMQCPDLVVDRIVAALQHSATAAADAAGAAAASKM